MIKSTKCCFSLTIFVILLLIFCQLNLISCSSNQGQIKGKNNSLLLKVLMKKYGKLLEMKKPGLLSRIQNFFNKIKTGLHKFGDHSSVGRKIKRIFMLFSRFGKASRILLARLSPGRSKYYLKIAYVIRQINKQRKKNGFKLGKNRYALLLPEELNVVYSLSDPAAYKKDLEESQKSIQNQDTNLHSCKNVVDNDHKDKETKVKRSMKKMENVNERYKEKLKKGQLTKKQNELYEKKKRNISRNAEGKRIRLSPAMRTEMMECMMKKFSPWNLKPTYAPLKKIKWGRNKVARVQDQGSCGSCWAFATAGMVESVYAIQTHTKVNPLSKQQMIDCFKSQTKYPGGCNGGHPIFAADYLSSHRLVPNIKYKYQDEEGKECLIKDKMPGLKIEANLIPKVTPNELYEILMTVGPVAVSIDAIPFEFTYYKKGILKYNCIDSKANHALLLVGYGYDKKRQEEYWVLKNSWGKSWGEKGHVRLLKSDNYNGCYIYEHIIKIDRVTMEKGE
jgi:C1A family cysteine protease